MSQKLTRQGARNLTVALDRIASVVQNNPGLLGLDPKVALDFAKRADQISDAIEMTAVTNFPKSAAASNGGFDPSEIGEKVPGPLEQLDSDESWMGGEFTQQEFSELAEKQEAGLLPTKGDSKVASDLRARVARLERVLIRLAEEEEVEEEGKKKAGEEEEEVEEEVEEGKKKASAKYAGFNLFE